MSVAQKTRERRMYLFQARATGPNTAGAQIAPAFEQALRQLRQKRDSWKHLMESMDSTDNLKVFWARQSMSKHGVTGDVHITELGVRALSYRFREDQKHVDMTLHSPPEESEWSKGYALFHAHKHFVCVVLGAHLKIQLVQDYFNRVLEGAGIIASGVYYAFSPPPQPNLSEALDDILSLRLQTEINAKTGAPTLVLSADQKSHRFFKGLSSFNNRLAKYLPRVALSKNVSVELLLRMDGRGHKSGAAPFNEITDLLLKPDGASGMDYELRDAKGKVVRNGELIRSLKVRLIEPDNQLPVLLDVERAALQLLEQYA